jgi:glycosyltransferase involved in cell wall biosynthesis
MKIAIVHDWLTTYAGAEKVLEQILQIYPQADLFSLIDFLPEQQRGFILNKPVKTSFIQNLPFARAKYRNYLPLMPLAIEQLDLSAYELIISSSHAVAKGVLSGPDQLHISYIHSPIRYAWDLQHQYLKESGLNKGIKGMLAKYILHKIRLWDYRSSVSVDSLIANSQFISRRIRKVYGREAKVIYPPVDINAFELSEKKEGFYLTASRMVPYKKIDLLVEAFGSMPGKELIVIGDGPDFAKIKAKAKSNVRLLGYQSFDILRTYMQRARAFVFAAEEDFGITPLEAQACGTPVIAFGKGGVLETIKGLDSQSPTGVFFDRQNIESITEAVKKFEALQISPAACRENVIRFGPERFRREFSEYVQNGLESFKSRKKL